jgi:hypothetical protein
VILETFTLLVAKPVHEPTVLRVYHRHCDRAGFRPKFVQKAAGVSNMFTLIGSEDAVTLVPAYLKSFPVAAVAMMPFSETKARWDFLVVWQRGRTAQSLRALFDALVRSLTLPSLPSEYELLRQL